MSILKDRSLDDISMISSAIPIALAYLSVSFIFGATAVKMGLPAWSPVLMSLFVYAGASQFTAISLLSAGAPAWAVVSTTFLVNSRHALMSLYCSKILRNANLSRLQRAIYAVGLTDEAFAVHSAQQAQGNLLHFKSLVSFNLFLHSTWVLGTLCGVIAAYYLSHLADLNLGFALVAMMVHVAVSLCNSKAKIWCAASSVSSFIVIGLFFPSGLTVLLSTMAGCGVGLCLKNYTSLR